MSGATMFDCHTLRVGVATDTEWVEAKDAAVHSTLHTQPPTTKNHPAQNANSAEMRSPARGRCGLHWRGSAAEWFRAPVGRRKAQFHHIVSCTFSKLSVPVSCL